jgi:hypothetical protein
MTDLIQAHLEAIENLQAELEDRIKKALGDISPDEILARADELPQEIADELSNWIDEYLLTRLVREATKFLLEANEEGTIEVDEDRVRSAILMLLDHYKTTVTTLAAAAFGEIANQARLQENMGRSTDAILQELENSKSGIGARLKGFENSLIHVTDSFVSSAGGVVVLTSASEPLTWVTVLDKKVCADCDKRHGVTKTAAEWIELGVPRSGWSVCTGHCRCLLVTASSFQRGGSPGPIVRERRK